MALADTCPRCGFDRMGGECPDHPRMIRPMPERGDRDRQDFMRLVNECESRLLGAVHDQMNLIGAALVGADAHVSSAADSWVDRLLGIFGLARRNETIRKLRSRRLDWHTALTGCREELGAAVRHHLGAIRAGHPDNPKFERLREAGHVLTVDGWLLNEKIERGEQ